MDRKVKVKSVFLWLTTALFVAGWTLGCVVI